MKASLERAWAPMRALISALAVLSGLAVLAMIGVTVVDVLLRLFRVGIKGAYDIVRVAAVVSIACGLPYVTAVKGHIAIEFFYHRFGRLGRLILDGFLGILSLALTVLLVYQNALYGAMLLKSRQVMPTLSIPVFWIPWLIGFSFILVFFATLYHLLNPGKEMMKP